MKANETPESRYYGDKHAETMCAAFPGDEELLDADHAESHTTDIIIAMIAILCLVASAAMWPSW